MRWINLIAGLAMSVSLAISAQGTEPKASAPSAQGRSVATQDFQVRRRWRPFYGSKNWWNNRGTPADNSTIPTPINRHPKGRPFDPIPIFPKNM
jgi:hypothetical protein